MINSKLSKRVNFTLWTVQWILSMMMLSGAVMKLMPIENVAPMMPWMGQVPEYMVRGLAFVDLAGGVGIVIPALLSTKKQWTVLSAMGIFLLMMCAVVFHVLRGEAASIGINIFTGTLALIVVVGRWYELRVADKTWL